MVAGRRRFAWKLMVLSAVFCLFASAGLRLPVGMAWAKSETEEAKIVVDQPAQCSVDPDYIPFLQALRSREEAVQDRTNQLNQMALDLMQTKSEIEAHLRDLARAEQALRNVIAMAKEASETDLVQLTSVYESMKPKEASALFEKMAPEFAAGFLGRMDPSAAAGILSGLDTDHAYAISVILAGRNADIPLN